MLRISEDNKDLERGKAWSDLPPEVLSIIKHKVVLSGTCLNLFPKYAFPVDDSPLILHKRAREDNVLHYYSPVFDRSFIVPCPVDLSNTILRLESHGWLLLSRGTLGVLLVNPLAGISYKLPDMKSLPPLNVCAFSAPPSLPLPDNFIIFKVDSVLSITFITIYINGDWAEEKSFENSYPFPLSRSTPIYRNGLFYCFSLVGNIATFNPTNDEWICHDKPNAIDPTAINTDNSCYFIETKGEFISIFQNKKRNKLSILKLNEASMEWEKCSCCVLDDSMALFIGYPKSIVSRVSKHSMRNKIVFTKVFGEEKVIHAEIKVFEGRIYFVDKSSCLMDNLEVDKNDEKNGVCYCSFANTVEYDFDNSKEFIFSIWYEAKF